jgi:hypothetical protein
MWNKQINWRDYCQPYPDVSDDDGLEVSVVYFAGQSHYLIKRRMELLMWRDST